MLSGKEREMDFGIISPKIKSKKVEIIAALRLEDAEWQCCTVMAVIRVPITMLTMLFPIKLDIKKVFLSFRSFSTRLALFNFILKYFIFNKLQEIKAVSPEEKNIEKKRRNKIAAYCHQL